MFELARESAIADSSRRRKAVFTSVKVSVGSSESEEGELVTAVFSQRQPTGAGPEKRVPIRSGGGACVTIEVKTTVNGKPVKGQKVTVCTDWVN